MKTNPTVDAYISGVIDGSIVVGPWIKKAIQRHLRDLERKDICFDPDAANYVIDFCQKFCIPPNQDTPIQLYPAQQVWLAIVYGWKRLDGTRRFRRTFWLVSKKNGKECPLRCPLPFSPRRGRREECPRLLCRYNDEAGTHGL